MADIPIPSGPTNKEIIDLAYLGLGISDSMFGRTDEEYASGMTLLRAMMGEYPFNRLGYDFSDARPAEKSGISADWLTATGLALGERIGATIGKQLSSQFRKVKAETYSRLCAAVHTFAPVQYAEGTVAGSGKRFSRWGDPFFSGVIREEGA